MTTKPPKTDSAYRKKKSTTTTEHPIEMGKELLVAFSNTWKAPDDLAENSTVTDVISETAEKHIINTLHVNQSLEEATLTESEYQNHLENTIAFEDRFNAQPSEYTNASVEALTRDAPKQTCSSCNGDLEIACTNCSTGQVTCSGCTGRGKVTCDCRNGKIRCDTCRGSGSVTQNDERIQCTSCHGKGSFQCKECGGRGSYRCPRCSGSGRETCGRCGGTQIISCPTCDAEGYVYSVIKGELDFTAEQDVMGVSDIDVPESQIIRASGTRFDERIVTFDPPEQGKSGKLRQTTEYRLVPVTKTTYTYDGTEYSLFDIDGTLHAPSYPKSTYRKFAPYIVLLLVVLIGAGIYVFFL